MVVCTKCGNSTSTDSPSRATHAELWRGSDICRVAISEMKTTYAALLRHGVHGQSRDSRHMLMLESRSSSRQNTMIRILVAPSNCSRLAPLSDAGTSYFPAL